MSERFFETPRLIARRFEPRDLAAFVAMRSNPQIAEFQNWENFTDEDGRKFLSWVQGRDPGDPGWFQFALEEKSSGAFIGDCGLRILESDNRLAQIGYTIAAPFWNRGYASEAVVTLIDYAFITFPLHRISASVDPLNTRSLRVLEKAGLAKEAHFRKSEWFKGEWADDAIYAILRTEWSLAQKTGQ
jgi:RimJ/RimL family protein N-acetyltransferase